MNKVAVDGELKSPDLPIFVWPNWLCNGSFDVAKLCLTAVVPDEPMVTSSIPAYPNVILFDVSFISTATEFPARNSILLSTNLI